MLYYWYYLQFHQNSLRFGTKWIRVEAFENLEILTERRVHVKLWPRQVILLGQQKRT